MRSSRAIGVAAAVLLLLAGACRDKAKTEATVETPQKPPFPINFDPADFDETSATIDNEWWPLPVGTQLTWDGEAFDGEDRVERRIVFTVTDLTKDVGGVTALVGWDRDFNDGVLSEGELIFLAQDKEGNVWHFGQYAELYDEEGQFDGGSAWIAGYLEGAKAGILMQADPKLGSPEYSEGYAPPPFFWDDFGHVYKTGQRTCVALGCYSDVMIIEEYEPTKPGAWQLKYYARGVGSVRTGWRGDAEEERETLELVKKVLLSPEELALARAEAMKLETRARVYGLVGPIVQPSPSP